MYFLFCSGAEYLKAEIIQRGFKILDAKTQRFANGEISFSIGQNIDPMESVCVLQSVTLGNVNDYIIELLLALDALKRSGIVNIDIVLPYMPYARQDRPMEHGYCVGAKVVTNLLSQYNPRTVSTIDIHNDRIIAFMDNEMVNILSDTIFKNDIQKSFPNISQGDVIFVSLDIGGAVRARIFADFFGTEYAVVDKRRLVNGKVESTRVIGDIGQKTCIIVDDMVDSGGTLFRGSDLLIKSGAKEVFCYITHPVISDPKKFSQDLLDSKVSKLTVSNTMNNILVHPKIKYIQCIDSIIESVVNHAR